MNEGISDALRKDMVVDITTIGRKSGERRRIEIWAHSLEGRVLITGSPGKRSWYANMLADPSVTLHLKGDVRIDLPATARAVTDPAERRELLTAIKGASGFEQRRTMDVEAWVTGSCLVELALRQ
ncbi:MAG: nitroreductase family deazaflavin-dependent oxidoreductase [Chloroflexi bacterium]|nr:nitroreductase family deazaflavin-dependent oxidoreductase [Chloroflexota bacterium]